MSGAVTSDRPARRSGSYARRSTRRRSRDTALTGRYRALFCAIVFLIIYGSLYPFNFDLSDTNLLGVKATVDFWRITTSRGDVLGNFALFVPFGCVGMLALVPHRSRALRLILLLILGFAVAAGVQVLQIFLPTRTASVVDVFWNLCGCALGALLLWPRQIRDQMLNLAGVSFSVAPACLLGSWLATELIPFVPSIDFQSFKDSLKPLVAVPDILSIDFLGAAVSSSAAIFLADRAWPGRVRTAWLVCSAAGLVLAKVVIVQNTVTANFAAGIMAALLLSPLVLRDRRPVASLLAAALAVYIAANALEPFTLRSEPQGFSWVPFSGSLSGSMMVNAKAVCAKVFVLGTLLYCLTAAGVRQAAAVALAALLALLLEVAQRWVGAHTPEITDPLLVLLLGLLMIRLDEGMPDARGPRKPEGADDAWPAAPDRQPGRPTEGSGRRRRAASVTAADWRAGVFSRGIILALAACVLAALAMNVMLGLPQIPYNVRELFGGDNAWWRLFVFTLAGLSIGAGGALAGRIAAERQRVFLILPGSVLAACLVTYLLFLYSVTGESLGDIAGSSNTYQSVMNDGMWGAPGLWLYQTIGDRWPIDMVERVIRFVALFGQMLLWIAILSATYFRLLKAPHDDGTRYRAALTKAGICLLAAAPWLVMLNLVAFQFASTDNLTELFAGHGHILYLLFILLPVAAVFVAHVLRRPSLQAALVAAVVLLVSLPVGWLLFKNGLNPAVEKYGQVFSGVDFLLGPDRVERLPESVLMLRWFLIQSAVIVGLAIGIQAVPAPLARAQRHPEIEGL